MQTRKITGAVLGLMVVGVAVAAAFMQPRRSISSTSTSTEAPTQTTSTYSLAQIAEHPNATSCWTSVNGQVYDLTAWIAQHPGGQENILSVCGKDGSAAFNAQHGGQRQPEQMLATFKIGSLTQ